MVDPINTSVTVFSSVIGLLGIWKSRADANKTTDFNQFIDWLRRQEYQQLVDLILGSKELQVSIKSLVEGQHEQVMQRLTKLDQTLSSVARHLDDFRSLAQAISPESQLSEQAVSILRRMNETDAAGFIVSKSRAGTSLKMLNVHDPDIEIREERFIEDDLEILEALGLLLLRNQSKYSRYFVITRTGAEVGGWRTTGQQEHPATGERKAT